MSKIVIESDHVPPSVNNLFVNIPGRGRVPSKSYLAWQKIASPDYSGLGHISGEYEIEITLDRTKVRKNSDLSNRIKACEDLIVKREIVEDDRLCVRLSICYGPCDKAIRIEINGTQDLH